MPISSVEAFIENVQAFDEREAHLIDSHFDSPALAGLEYGDRLDSAIAAAHEELAPNVIGGSTFGYQVARDALRWMRYHNAGLDDNLRGTRRTDPTRGSREKYGSRDDQKISANMIDSLNPLYFSLFATLEKTRVSRERAAGHAIDIPPVQLERDYALRGLMNACDRVLEGSDAIHVGAERFAFVEIKPAERPVGRSCFYINRQAAADDLAPSKDGPNLLYALEALGTKDPSTADAESQRPSFFAYRMLEDLDNNISFIGPRPSAHFLMQLVQEIAPTGNKGYVFSRPSRVLFPSSEITAADATQGNLPAPRT